MATTAMFVEVLIVGLQSLTWLALLLASIYGVGSVSLRDFKDWQTPLLAILLAISYVLGIIVDRIADTAFNKIRKLINRKSVRDSSLPSFAQMRLRIMMQNDAVSKFMDYQRSRLRIARASVFNVLLITIFGTAFMLTQTDMDGPRISLYGFFGLGLVCICLFVTIHINNAQDNTINDAYNLITGANRRAAAVCYRPVDGHIEILLVRTSDCLRWTFPKGHIESHESPPDAAAREAREEAGVEGNIDAEPIAEYAYPLLSKIPDVEKEQVLAFLLEVTKDKALSEKVRNPTWFKPQEAIAKLAENRESEFAIEHERVINIAVGKLGYSIGC